MARRYSKNGNGRMTKAKKRALWYFTGALAIGILAPKFLPADWYAKIATTIGLEVT